MKRLLLLCVCLAAICGCKTTVEVRKFPEEAKPIKRVATIDGNQVLYTSGYTSPMSGGWLFRGSSPLFATEALRGWDAEVAPDGTVRIRLDSYDRDLSTNAVEVARITADGIVNLASKVAAAIVSSGASPAADGVSELVRKFVASGGDAAKATVSCRDGTCTVTDGCVTCDDSGCSACGEN